MLQSSFLFLPKVTRLDAGLSTPWPPLDARAGGESGGFSYLFTLRLRLLCLGYSLPFTVRNAWSCLAMLLLLPLSMALRSGGLSLLLPVSYPLLLATDPFCPVVEVADPLDEYPLKFSDRLLRPPLLSVLYLLNSGQSDPPNPDKLISCNIFCVSIILTSSSLSWY